MKLRALSANPKQRRQELGCVSVVVLIVLAVPGWSPLWWPINYARVDAQCGALEQGTAYDEKRVRALAAENGLRMDEFETADGQTVELSKVMFLRGVRRCTLRIAAGKIASIESSSYWP